MRRRGSNLFPRAAIAAIAIAALALAALAGCGSRRERADREVPGDGGRAADPGPAPLPPAEPLPLGLRSLEDYAYNRGPGRPVFVRAIEVERALQWDEAAALSRQVLETNPGHLEAWWVLATALARQDAHDQVLAPLSAAVAGDWLRWGERSLEDEALAGFLGSVHGQRYRDLAELYRERYRQTASEGLLVVGRRGKPWYPRRKGEVVINHRSEIYAYDLAEGRYLRVSRTDGSLAGYVRAPVGAALAYASYRRVVIPGDGLPYLAEVRVGTIDLEHGRMSAQEVAFPEVAALYLGYEAGADGKPAGAVPVVRVQSARDGAMRTYAPDFDSGQSREREAGAQPGDPAAHGSAAGWPGAEILVVAYGQVRKLRIPVDGVAADWDDAGTAGAFRLERTRKTVTLDAGASVDGHSMVWSPTQARLAFATAAPDPCASEGAARQVVLYAVEAATGKLRQVAEGEGAFAPVWLDDTRLAYMDEAAGAVLVVDVVTGDVLARLDGSGGVGTDRLPGARDCPAPPESPPGNAAASPAGLPAPAGSSAAGEEGRAGATSGEP